MRRLAPVLVMTAGKAFVAIALTACAQLPDAARPAARGLIGVRAKATGITLAFGKGTLRPLADKATNPEAAAERTSLTIQVNRDGAPVRGAKVALTAGFRAQSGGHLHDEAKRLVGAFYGAQALGSKATVTTDANGQAKLTYRGSGIGGVDVVAAAAEDLAGEGEVKVSYELSPLPVPGPEDHYELVGRTDDHPENHFCTAGTQALMKRLADEHFKLFAAPFKINDQSIQDGGPFDLGPDYGVPYFTLGSKHENHRQGNSTDIKSGTKAWREAITRLGGRVFVEASHWHVTTAADATVAAARLPQAFDAGRVEAKLGVTTRLRADGAIEYTYRATADRPLAAVALTVGAPVAGPGGAYFGRPLWGWAPAGDVTLVSAGLPAIVPAYLQAETPIPDVAALPADVSELAFAQALDVERNSRRQLVVAPGAVTTRSPKAAQRAHLAQQLRLAAELGTPEAAAVVRAVAEAIE